MDINKHIDMLFSDYEDSPELNEFKEELTAHLDERIKGFILKGMDDKTASEKALAELGDITQVADEIGKTKRQEVFTEMYMNTRSYISTKRGILYALCGLILGLAAILPFITWYASGLHVGAIGTILPFGMISILGFLFLGLTQETATKEPMSWKRALFYLLAVGLVLFGVITAFLTYFAVGSTPVAELAAHGANAVNTEMLTSTSVILVFCLPGIALGIFLFLTEKDRRKPWARERKSKSIN